MTREAELHLKLDCRMESRYKACRMALFISCANQIMSHLALASILYQSGNLRHACQCKYMHARLMRYEMDLLALILHALKYNIGVYREVGPQRLDALPGILQASQQLFSHWVAQTVLQQCSSSIAGCEHLGEAAVCLSALQWLLPWTS